MTQHRQLQPLRSYYNKLAACCLTNMAHSAGLTWATHCRKGCSRRSSKASTLIRAHTQSQCYGRGV